jgi:hypothetical protein
MSLFGGETRLGEGASHWLGPTVALLVALGGVGGVYAKFDADQAVADERIRTIEAREAIANMDHDLLIRIDARLGRIEAALAASGR